MNSIKRKAKSLKIVYLKVSKVQENVHGKAMKKIRNMVKDKPYHATPISVFSY